MFRGFCKPEGRGPGDSTGRSRLSVPRRTADRKIEKRLCPMRVLDALARATKPREKPAKLRLRIRQSVPRGTRQALRVTIRCRVADSHCLHLRFPPLCFARWTLCSMWNVSGLLKWARKCWPIDCHASAILTMRPAPNYVVANHNRFALCCEQLRFS